MIIEQLVTAYHGKTRAVNFENEESWLLIDVLKRDEIARLAREIEDLKSAAAEHLEQFMNSSAGLKHFVSVLEVIAAEVKDRGSLTAKSCTLLHATFGQANGIAQALLDMSAEADRVWDAGRADKTFGRAEWQEVILEEIEAAKRDLRARMKEVAVKEDLEAEASAKARCLPRGEKLDLLLRYTSHHDRQLLAAMNLIQDRTGGASQHKKVGKKTRRKQKDLFGQSMSSKHL